MSERSSFDLFRDILHCISRLNEYTADLPYDTFSENFMVQEACLYNLQIIGEVVSKLPKEIKDEAPSVPWNLMKGMRNRLIHEYFGTDLNIVWEVIKNELPAIEPVIRSLLQNIK